MADLIDFPTAQLSPRLAPIAASNPAYLTFLISVASQEIERVCMREFAQQSYTEYYTGNSWPWSLLQLRNFPVVNITRCATYPQVVLTITNTNPSNQRATVATNATGITLFSVSSAVPTTVVLSYANYPTIQLMANAIQAVGNGWTTSIQQPYGPWPSADLDPHQGAISAVSPSYGANLEMHTEEIPFPWRLDYQTGHAWGQWPEGRADAAVWLNGVGTPYYGGGRLNIRIDYTAGFATIPASIQEACIRLIARIYEMDNKDSALKSEKLGPYSYTLNSPTKSMIWSPDVMMLLASYIDHAKQQGRTPNSA